VLGPAKTRERIEMSFEGEEVAESRGSKEPCIRWRTAHIGATWQIRRIDRCGVGDAAIAIITVASCKPTQ